MLPSLNPINIFENFSLKSEQFGTFSNFNKISE
jgi:hypothetical protein